MSEQPAQEECPAGGVVIPGLEQGASSHLQSTCSSPARGKQPETAAQFYSWSAPTSPSSPRRKRASLLGVQKSKDVMHLAKHVLEEHRSMCDFEAQCHSKRDTVEARRKQGKAAVCTATKTTPPSLVGKTKGALVTPPEGWRTVWSATDHNQMRAADTQVAAEQARLLRTEQQQFNTEVSALCVPEQQGLTSRGCSSPGRAPSSTAGSPSSRCSSPTSQRQQRALEAAQRMWEEKQACVERKVVQKHAQARARTAQLQQQRQLEAAHKHKDMQAALQLAQQRQALMSHYRSAAIGYEAQVKAQKRMQSALHKESGASGWQQERLAARQATQGRVAARQQQLDDTLRMKQLAKLQALEGSAAAAATNRSQMTSARAQRAATQREARFATTSRQAARLNQARQAAHAHVMNEMQRINEMNSARAQAAHAHQQEVQHKQRVDLVARHYAHELELAAMITKRLPQLEPATLQALARLELHV